MTAPFLALITPLAGDVPPPVYPSHPWVPPAGPEGPPVAGWPGVPGNWPGFRPPPPPQPSHPWVPPSGPEGPPVAGWPGVPGNWPSLPGQPHPPTGPVDPGYSPPWAQVPPGGQGGGPVDPGYSPPWAQVPGTQPPPNLPAGGGVIVPLPEGANGPPPPEGTPEDHKPYAVWFGPGTVVSIVYLPPPATTKPSKSKGAPARPPV